MEEPQSYKMYMSHGHLDLRHPGQPGLAGDAAVYLRSLQWQRDYVNYMHHHHQQRMSSRHPLQRHPSFPGTANYGYQPQSAENGAGTDLRLHKKPSRDPSTITMPALIACVPDRVSPPTHLPTSKPGRPRRRRSRTVSSIPYHPKPKKVDVKKADDVAAMLLYYTQPTKAKKMKKAKSSSVLEGRGSDTRKNSISQEVCVSVPAICPKEQTALRNIRPRIDVETERREPVIECAAQDDHRRVSDDFLLDYLDSDDLPRLVIDLGDDASTPPLPEQNETSSSSKIQELQVFEGQSTEIELQDPTTVNNQQLSQTQADDFLQELFGDNTLEPPQLGHPGNDTVMDVQETPSYLATLEPKNIPTSSPEAPLLKPAVPSPSVEPSETPTPLFSLKPGKFPCKNCAKCFTSVSQLVKHGVSCSKQESQDQRLSCTKCSQSFTSKKACAEHWKEYHSTERPHECTRCGRRFTLHRALEKHTWTVHKN